MKFLSEKDEKKQVKKKRTHSAQKMEQEKQDEVVFHVNRCPSYVEPLLSLQQSALR